MTALVAQEPLGFWLLLAALGWLLSRIIGRVVRAVGDTKRSQAIASVFKYAKNK